MLSFLSLSSLSLLSFFTKSPIIFKIYLFKSNKLICFGLSSFKISVLESYKLTGFGPFGLSSNKLTCFGLSSFKNKSGLHYNL